MTDENYAFERNPVVVTRAAIPQSSNGNPLIHVIERASRDVEFPLDRLDHLISLYRGEKALDDERVWNLAMAAAQSEMVRVATDSTNPQTSSRYASYAALDAAVRPIYSRHGFALSFNTLPDASPEGKIRVACDVVNGAHRVRYTIDMPTDTTGFKGTAMMTRTHAAGSAITYAMRYLLKMIFNIAVGEGLAGKGDDDGNAAGSQAKPIEETITADEIANLEQLLAARAGPDPAGIQLRKTVMLKFYGVDDITKMTKTHYEHAVRFMTTPPK